MYLGTEGRISYLDAPHMNKMVFKKRELLIVNYQFGDQVMLKMNSPRHQVFGLLIQVNLIYIVKKKRFPFFF